jgi:hypothetical protein
MNDINHTASSIVPRSRTAGLISALILACLGIQGFITIALLPVLHGSVEATWPFVNYGMYCQAHREGDLIPKRIVMGLREDGSEAIITPEDLGWSNWFYQIFADAILNRDRTVVNGFLSHGPGTRDRRWISLRVVDQGMAFHWTGSVPLPEKELGTMRVEPVRKERQ